MRANVDYKMYQTRNRIWLLARVTCPTVVGMPACGRQGRKTALHFFRGSDDDISDQEFFKKELEKSGNSGRL